MKTALLTSSETFGNYLFHPGKWLVLWAQDKIVADHKIASLVFPSITLLPEGVEDPGTTIIKKAQEISADVILSFGLSSSVKGFRIERTATNWSENKYCQLYEQRKPLEKQFKPKEHVQTDLTKWDFTRVHTLAKEKGISLEQEISDDPGQYSCNSWMYRTLKALKKYNVSIAYLFIHCACTEEAIECIQDFPMNEKILITRDDLKKALEIFLQSYIKS